MTRLRMLVSRVLGLFGRNRLDHQLDEEIRSHIEMETEENIRRGLSPTAARQAALRSFGGVEQVKEHYRDLRGIPMLDSLRQDLRYALRRVTGNVSFSCTVVVLLGIGIGANSAVFSVVNSTLLKPVPYLEPDRLVRIWDSHPNASQLSVAPGNFFEWEKRNRVFNGLGAYREDGFSISGEGIPERVDGARVTAELLRVLGVQPIRGRWFTEDEDRPEGDRVVLLGYGLWQRRFGGDEGVLGKVLRIDGEPHTIVGVMPETFRVPIEGAELWTPYVLDRIQADRSSHFLRVLARLKPNTTVAEARIDIDRVAAELEEEYPETNKQWRARILPLDESINGDIDRTLWILLGAVGLLLLLANVNVANLLLARSVSRRKEIALRLSMGASRPRLFRQLVVESSVLSILGGLLGIAVALVAVAFFRTQLPDNLLRIAEASIDPQVLLFTAVLSILSGLVFGVAPAASGSMVQLGDALKLEGHGTTAGKRSHRTIKVLVVMQVSIAMVVVISSGLMIRSLWNLHAIDPGFQTDGRLTLDLHLNSEKYSEPKGRAAFLSRTIEALGTVPGVLNVAATHRLPMTGNSGFGSVEIEGHPQERPSPTIIYRSVTSDYFAVMGIPLLRGRTFDQRETDDAGGVVVINENMARRFWPAADALGKRFRVGQGSWMTVIGIAADSKESALDGEVLLSMYIPYLVVPSETMTIVVHAANDSVAAGVRQELHKLDADLGVAALKPLGTILDASIGQRSFTATLLAIFAAIALLVATSGIYSVLAYSVNERAGEIGLRIGLGANRSNVIQHFVGGGVRLIAFGIALGSVIALIVTQLLSSLLFGVTASDPGTFLAIAAFVMMAGVLACYLPARRASLLNPLVVWQRR